MNKFSRIPSFLNQIVFSTVFLLSIVTNVSAFQGGGGGVTTLMYTPSMISGSVGTPITSASPMPASTGGATSFFATPSLSTYGLSFDATSGIISGTPTSSATAQTITIEGYNGATKVSQGSVTLNITGGGGGVTTLMYTPSMISGSVGTPITSASPMPASTGGATSFFATPSLSTYGLSFDATSGIISGTPTSSATAQTITIEGYNGATKVSQGSVTLNITGGGGGVTTLMYTPSMISGSVGTPITSASPMPASTGGATSFFATPSLSTYGLSFDATSGIISGTPTSSATAQTITIEGYNGATKVSQGSVTLNITGGGGGVTTLMYTPSMISGSVGTPITSASPMPASTGGATSFFATPSLSTYGLSFDATSGIISGTPTSSATAQTITIEGYNGATKVSQGSVTLNITGGGGGVTTLMYTPSMISGSVGTPITSASPMPASTGGATSFFATPSLSTYGLSFDATSGIISGTPTSSATAQTITIEGYNGATKVSQGSVTLNITGGGGGVTTLMYTPSMISGSVGTPITSASPMPASTGGATSFFATPSLSTYGLSFDATSGIISGTPTSSATAQTITIEGYNGATKVSQGSVTLNITGGGGGVTTLMYTPSMISGSVGTPITSASPMPASTGGATSFFATPSLSTYGLSFDATSGIISGTPTSSATAQTITIEGYNGATKVSQGSVTLNITGGGGGSQNLSYTSNPYSVTVASSVSMTGATTSVIAPFYSSSNIPSWLNIIPSTGAIYSNGIVQSGTSSTNFTVTATGSNGSATTDIRINVYEGGKINHQLGTFSLADKTYGDAAFTLTPPASESIAPFSYSSSNTNVIQISGNTATIVGAGSATITVNQESDATYNASSTSASITVNKAPLTVTAENKSKTYGSANPSFTATITGFVNGQELASSDVTGAANFSTTATVTSPVTNYSITPSIGSLSSNNYSFSFVNGQLDITRAELTVIGLTANNKEYDGGFSATVTGTASLSGVIGSDDVQLAATPLYTFASKDVADGIAVSAGGFSLTGTTASNYRLTQPSFIANITAIQLGVSGSNVTLSKVYDGSTSASVVSAGTLSGVLGSETVTVSAVASYDTKDVGTSKAITVVYTLGGSGAGNYTAPSNGTLSGSITAIQLGVSGSNVTLSKVYDGSTSASVVSAGTLSGVLGSETVTVSAVASYDTKDVGTSKAITVVYTLGGSGAGNYTAPSNGTLSGSITAIQLGVSGSNVTLSKVYDGSTSASVVSAGTLSGVLGSETVTVSAVASYDTKDVGTSKAITVVYTLGGSGAGNYTAPSNGTLSGSITAIQLGVSGSNVTLSKVYDGSTSASVVSAGTLSGVLGSETVTVSAVASYDTKDVGTSKAITVVYTLGGSGAGNYTAPSNGTLSGSITAIQLGVSGSNVTLSKVYDGSTSASVVSAGTLSGVLGSETVTVSAVASYDTKDVGTSKAITVVYTLGGSGAGNYTAPSNGTLSGSITAIQLGVSGSNVTLSKVYDGSTSASVVSAGTLSGVLGSETVTVSAVASYDTKDVGTSKAITVVYTLGGSGAGNYTAPSNGTLSGSITAIQLGVSGSNVTLSKVYDGSTSASVVSAGTLSGVLGSETVTVSAVASYDTKDVGTSKAITVVYTLGGSGAGNYTAPSNGTLSGSITAIQLGVSGSNVTLSKVYDGSTSASVVSAGTLSGVLGSETVTVSAVASYDTKDVGTSKAITVVYTLGGSGAGNYTAPSNGTLSGSITAIQLGVSGSNVTLSKVYDGSTSASVVSAGTLSGVLGSETVTVSAVASYDTKDVGTSKAITVVYTLGGSGAGNYTAPSNGTLSGSITAIQLGVSGSNVTLSKVYDGSTSASVVSAGTLSGVLGSETVTVSAVASYDTKDVGTSKAITVVYTLGGSGAGNYTAPSNGTLSGSITPIQLIASTPTITKIKFVDGTTNADVIPGNVTGAITGDNIAVTVVGNYDDAEIGKNKKITVVYALSGIDKNNYQKPTDFIVNDGEIKDFPPANLLYSPSSALSSLNIPMTTMLPSNTGGKVVSYSVNPSLPAGLTINATTGVISGTRTANVSGSFNYTVTAENSGGSTTSQITLIFNTAPSNIQLSKSELYESNAIGDEIGILSTTDIDANETHSYELIEGVGADDNASFTVSGNRLLANQKFNYQTKNTYSIRIRVKDKAGLTFEKTLVVKVLELPKVVGANSSQYNGPVSNTPIISLGFGSQLQIQGSDIVSVSWSPAAGLSSTNSLNPIAKPTVTTTYTVIITHKSGSKVELKITVEVRNDYAIEPSTILTPNNDGYNDFWVIKNIDAYANNEVFIYDRNGRLLYNMKNYNNRWDGKINGRPLAAGTYYYIIRFSQQPNVNFKGFITIAIN